MVSGLATDRNRRPPTALLLAQGFETIADQMADGRRPGPPAPPRTSPPPAEATVVTNPTLPSRAIEPMPPPVPTPAPSYPPAAYLTPGPPVAHPDPYAMGVISTTEEPQVPAGRGFGYYLLLVVAALALFAISMFITILLLS